MRWFRPLAIAFASLAVGCVAADGSFLDEGRTRPKKDAADPFDDYDVGDRPFEDGGAGFDVKTLDEDADASCAKATETATPIPLDLFVMLDQSASMKETTSSGATKWSAIKDAFKAFLSDPASTGIGFGLQYFGQTGFFSGGESSCSVSEYSKASVEIAPLPGVASSIITSLTLHTPFTDTPTGPALQGAIAHAHAWRSAHPNHVVVVVLATDGMPTACTPLDIPGIAALASAASAEKPPLRTYVIGVLSDDDLVKGGDKNLNEISKAGNGEDAFIVKTSSSDVSKSFLAALTKIRGTALACEYLVPTGAGADYGKVNVVVTSGSKSTTIPYVGSKSKCDPAKGGWYYDVPPETGKPTKILTCDATCKSLSLDSTGKIDIVVGCATVRPK